MAAAMIQDVRTYLDALHGGAGPAFTDAQIEAALERAEEPVDAEFSTMTDLKDSAEAKILKLATGALGKLSQRIQKEILDAIDTDRVGSFWRIRGVLSRYRNQYARTLTDAKLAALLAGAKRVVDQLPVEDQGLNAPGARAGRAVELPASLAPAPADALVEQARTLSDEMRQLYIEALTPEQARYVRERLGAESGLRFRPHAPPVEPPWEPPTDFESESEPGEPPIVTFPLIDEAVKDLQDRRLVVRDEFDQLYGQAREEAFTVANVETDWALGKVLNALSSATEEGDDLRTFKRAVADAVGTGTFLSDGHAETVFRTNIQTAYSRGMDRVLDNPLVVDAFPYEETLPIDDQRLTELCATISKSGISGSGVFRRDDPVWLKFKPPRHFNCRCGRRPLTLRMAARAGIQEAKTWLETGEPPAAPAFVPMPRVELPKEWRR